MKALFRTNCWPYKTGVALGMDIRVVPKSNFGITEVNVAGEQNQGLVPKGRAPQAAL
jgi:hypothetical protein